MNAPVDLNSPVIQNRQLSAYTFNVYILNGFLLRCFNLLSLLRSMGRSMMTNLPDDLIDCSVLFEARYVSFEIIETFHKYKSLKIKKQ